jgi:ankyrin repeat protein
LLTLKNSTDGHDDETTLHFAVKSGNMEIVKLLLDKGADRQAATRYRRLTPAIYAVSLKDPTILETFFMDEINSQWRCARGYGVFHYLRSRETAELLVKKFTAEEVKQQIFNAGAKSVLISCMREDSVKLLEVRAMCDLMS